MARPLLVVCVGDGTFPSPAVLEEPPDILYRADSEVQAGCAGS